MKRVATFFAVIVLSALVLAFGACVGVPLRDVAYHASLPPGSPATFETAKAFANALDKSLELRASDVPPMRGIAGGVSMKPARAGNVGLMIFANPSLCTLDITIVGDVESPIAKAIDVEIQRTFHRLYPQQAIVRYVRKQDLLGP